MGEKRQRELEIFEFMDNSDNTRFKRGHFILSVWLKVPSVTIVQEINFSHMFSDFLQAIL